MRIAAIDLGTNSFLCLIADVDSREQKIKTIKDVAHVVRLGEKVHENKAFLPQALTRAEKCLDEFQNIIEEYSSEKVIATATSAARDVKNGQELLEIGKKRNIPIHIIGGEKEAELSFLGTVSGIKNFQEKKIAVIDVGGGSTEFIYHEPGKKLNAKSFDVGCVRLTEMFLKTDPIDWSEYEKLHNYAEKIISQYPKTNAEMVMGVAGTPTTLACINQEIKFDHGAIDGYKLSRKQIQDLCKTLGDMPLEKRKNTAGLEPLRADVIVAGCALLDVGLKALNKNELKVSTRGLRYGVALRHEEFS